MAQKKPPSNDEGLTWVDDGASVSCRRPIKLKLHGIKKPSSKDEGFIKGG